MLQKNSIVKSYILFWKNAVNFKGRTRRSDFWQAYVINLIITDIIGIFIPVLPLQIILLVPNLALFTRRFHDIGKDGRLSFTSIHSLMGLPTALVLFRKDSQPGTNKYGENPKGIQVFEEMKFSSEENSKTCPICKAEITNNAACCPACGHRFDGVKYE